MDGGVDVCSENGVFDFFFGNYSEVEKETTVMIVSVISRILVHVAVVRETGHGP